jgi:hypothetical protein
MLLIYGKNRVCTQKRKYLMERIAAPINKKKKNAK